MSIPTLIQQMQPFIQHHWEMRGYKEVTEVQKQTIPLIMNGMDLIVESPTGTGKTLAYLLPLLNQVDPTVGDVQIVILAPTRELVMQIYNEALFFTKESSIQSVVLLGGADINRQIEKLKKRPQIVIGTPGRILELADKKKLKLHTVRTLVIDEADQLFHKNFIELVQGIIKKTLKERQLLIFSATIPNQIVETAKGFMKEVQVLRIKESKNRVNHFYIICESRKKLESLRKIAHIQEVQKAIVFVAESKNMDYMLSKLQYMNIPFVALSGESTKLERERAIRSFRENRVPILVTTDVAARGLDFANVTHVIHLDLPENVDQYIHRSGRTGRMGNSGTVVSIITENETGRLRSFAKQLKVQLQEKILYKGKFADPITKNQSIAAKKPTKTS